jgi:Zn-finger nucleic acid-binding protein
MFRDGRPRCPSCRDEHALVPQPEQRTRLHCEHCRGVLIPLAEVEDMLSTLQGEPFVVPAGNPGTRTCACCTTTLATLALFEIEVDRCDAHGIWFDGKELTSVLEAASGVDPATIPEQPEKRGALGMLRSLFGSRHTLPGQPRRPRDDD